MQSRAQSDSGIPPCCALDACEFDDQAGFDHTPEASIPRSGTMKAIWIVGMFVLGVAITGRTAQAQCFCIPDVRFSSFDPVVVGNTSGNQIGNGYNVTVRDVSN